MPRPAIATTAILDVKKGERVNPNEVLMEIAP
jgi:hypothetical protein